VSCLSPEDALKLLRGELEGAEEARAHADGCPRCHAIIAETALTFFEDDEPKDDEVVDGAGADTTSRLKRGTVLADRFVILDALGQGGMGEVLLAHDNVLRREVAIKVVRSGTAEREARLLAAVKHPHVVAIHDLVSTTHGLVIAMEYVEGESLDRWSRDRRGRDVDARLFELGEALVAVHAAGLVHGDIKPSNVLVDEQRKTRLIDFGLASDDSADGRGGTALYLAPERLNAAVGPTAASDLWALAATWVESRTKARPTEPSGFFALTARLPLALRAPLRRALATDPAARFATVLSFLKATRRRRRVLLAVTVGVSLLLASAAVVIAGRVEADRTETCVAELTGEAPSLPNMTDVISSIRLPRDLGSADLGDALFAAVDSARDGFFRWREHFEQAARLACTEPAPLAGHRRLCLVDERQRVAILKTEMLDGRVDARRLLLLDWIRLRAVTFPCLDETRLGDPGPLLESLLLRQLGALRTSLGKTAVLGHLRRLGPSEMLGLLELEEAVSAYARRDIEAAWRGYEQVLAVARVAGPTYREADALWGLATLAIRERSDPSLARLFMRLAPLSTPGFGELGHRVYRDSLEMELAWLEGDAERTLEAADRAIAAQQALNSYPAPALALSGLALLELGEVDAAERRFNELLTWREQQVPQRPERIAGAKHNLALVALARRDWDKAGGLLDEALQLRLGALSDDHPDVARVRITRARWAAEAKSDPNALLDGEAALDTLTRHIGAGHAEVARGHDTLADVARRLGELEAAHRHHHTAKILSAVKGLGGPGAERR